MKVYIYILSAFLLGGCVHRSILLRPDDVNKKYAFQYCGGQMWGYRKKLIDEGSIYMAVYLENHVKVSPKEFSVVNFAISGKRDLDFSFDEVQFKIDINGQKRERSESLWVAKDAKSIGDRFSGNKYDWTHKEGTTWVLRKKRFGLGMLALGEPFEVTLPTYKNEEVKTARFKIDFDKENVRELFVFDKFILDDMTADKMQPATIGITTPAFTLNGQKFPSERFVFNLDRERIARKIEQGVSRCASMEEVFRFGRGTNIMFDWLGPHMID